MSITINQTRGGQDQHGTETMATDQEIERAMTIAGLSARDRWTVAPFLRAAKDPIRWIDVSKAFGIKPADMHRVATAFRVLHEKWGMGEAFAAEQLLRVGPLLAMHVGIDIDDAATAIGILFRAGSHSPGTGLYSAVVKSARDRGSVCAHYEHIERAVHRYGEVQPATWEATVLPMLKRAMAKRPEILGAKVKLENSVDRHFEVKLHGEGWDSTAYLRRGPLVVDIENDCNGAARSAAEEAARALASKADAGGTHLAERALAAKLLGPPDRPRMVAVQPPNEPPALDEMVECAKRTCRTPLPIGWRWDPYCLACADGPDGEFAILSIVNIDTVGQVATCKTVPPAVLDAMRTEASRHRAAFDWAKRLLAEGGAS